MTLTLKPRLYGARKVTRRYWAIEGEWRERSPFRSSAVDFGSVMAPSILGDRRGRLSAETEADAGAGQPQFLKDEFDTFLECGILAHGFLRSRCGGCSPPGRPRHLHVPVR